jgi:Tol biopolymer transport system component
MLLLVVAAAPAQTTRVSVTAGNAQVSGHSHYPSVSADGNFVAFISEASGLVPDDTNGLPDLFVKDRGTGTVTRLTLGTGVPIDGVSGPVISGNGRFVAFVTSSALIPADTNLCDPSGYDVVQLPCPDVYVHDRQTGSTTRVSVSSTGAQGNRESGGPAISADGRYVLFNSRATTLVNDGGTALTSLYVHDRQTGETTRVGLATNGTPAAAYGGAISASGRVVAFIAYDTQEPSAPICAPMAPVRSLRAYVRDLDTGVTTCVPPAFVYPAGFPPLGTSFGMYAVVLSADGSTVAVVTGEDSNTSRRYIHTYNRLTGVVSTLLSPTEVTPHTSDPLALSPDGRLLAVCERFDIPPPPIGGMRLFDTTRGQLQSVKLARDGGAEPGCSTPSFVGTGAIVFASPGANLVANDTNDRVDVFAVSLDFDQDGMADAWETSFGLDPANAADASADPDADGRTNKQEYDAGSHPKGTVTRYLAEGAVNAFFQTDVHVYNPGTTAATVVVRLLGENTQVTSTTFTLPGQGVTAIHPTLDDASVGSPAAPDQAFSVVVESDQILAVERTMKWGDEGGGLAYGEHIETATGGPRTSWYFAEGATHGSFDEFLLLQNPNATDVTATVTYLLPAPAPPIVHTYGVPAHSRRTIWVDQEPGLAATDVSATVTATAPILAERALYLSSPTQPFGAGHDGLGLAAPALEWFVPEGATGAFFDLYLLVGNPGSSSAMLSVTYLLPDGTSLVKSYTASAQSRLTIGVDAEDASLQATAVSIVVRSTNNVPVVVERAMWWPSPTWYEGSLSAATTVTGRRWAMADGPIGSGASTYLLIANPGDTAGSVTLAFVDGASAMPRCTSTVPLAAHSRTTFDIGATCGGALQGAAHIAATITSDGPAIVVERSTYVSSPTRLWTAGGSAILTPLPEP